MADPAFILKVRIVSYGRMSIGMRDAAKSGKAVPMFYNEPSAI